MKQLRNNKHNLSLEILKPSLFFEQVLNSILSFIMIREIISVSSLTFMSNFNTLVVISYAVITISRLFLQNSISKGILNYKTALRTISQSNLLRIIFGFATLFLLVSLNDISHLSAVLLLISIAAMDFVRYFCLFTGRTIPSLAGNAVSVFLCLNWIIWFSDPHLQPEKVVLIWVSLNWIYVASTVLFGLTPNHRIPSDLFIDKTFTSNFRLILLDSVTIQLFQTLCSVGLLYFVPEANAAARIGSQVFLSIPNLLIASTAPFLALYVAKGLISYNSRFNLMLIQLFFFIIPITLIFLPSFALDTISGSSDRYYLVYQIGFIANGMSIFAISSFSYGHIQLVGTRRFLTYKLSLLTCTLLFPLIALVFFGVIVFNTLAIVTLCVAIVVSKKYISAKI